MDIAKSASKTKVVLMSVVLAFILSLTMMPFAPMQQAFAEEEQANLSIEVGTGEYSYNPLTDRYVLSLDPSTETVVLGSAYVPLIQNPIGYGAAFYRNQAPAGWQIAVTHEYYEVDKILTRAIDQGLPTVWDEKKVLGFATTDVPAPYTLYVSPYAKVSGSTALHMGLNTMYNSTQFGIPSVDPDQYTDKLLTNGTDYPKAVLATDSVTHSLSSAAGSQYAGDFLNWPVPSDSERPLLPAPAPDPSLRYLEGGVIGDSAGSPLDTWGRRFPSSVTTLYILSPQ